MTISVRNAGVFSNAQPNVRTGGAWNAVREGFVRLAGVWTRFYASLLVAASDVLGSGAGFSPSGSVNTSSSSPNTTVTGAAGAVTYAWQYISGDATVGISNSAAANPIWNAVVSDGINKVAVWRVTATDTTTGATASDDITITLSWTNLT